MKIILFFCMLMSVSFAGEVLEKGEGFFKGMFIAMPLLMIMAILLYERNKK